MAAADELLVALDAVSASERLVTIGKRLADALGLSLTILFVETPGSGGAEEPGDVLTLAVQMGATVAKAPAAELVEGASAYAAMSPVRHLILPETAGRRRRLFGAGRTGHRVFAEWGIDVTYVGVRPREGVASRSFPVDAPRTSSAVGYVAALIATAFAVPLLLLLRHLFGAQALGFLFVFPVLGIAASFGLRPALVSVLLSTLFYDLLVLQSVARLGVFAPQDLVMASALLIVAVYASGLTARLRERVALSDRSAQENASLAAFGVSLARAAEWETTGALVCKEVSRMFGVHSAVFREVNGELVLIAAEPAECTFGPIDRTALDVAWQQGDESGSGTTIASSADWQFHPLQTSLGTLAVVGVAREDGRSPIPTSRKLLLSTLLAQAALAHERLRLEDAIRFESGQPAGGVGADSSG